MIINNTNDVCLLDNGNMVIGKFEMHNSQFDFRGKDNILFCNGTVFENSYLRFGGEHSVAYFEKSKYPLRVETRMGFDSTLYFGQDNYINQKIYLYATERKNIIVGNECLFSFNVYMYTCDPHVLYDFSGKRINQSKNILVGDHVWIGQNSLILKGASMGSGCVVGGNSVVTSGTKKSNCVYAGNPANKVKKDIYFLEVAANNFDAARSERFEHDPQGRNELYIYHKDQYALDFSLLNKILSGAEDENQRLLIIKTHLSDYQYNNRFFIGE